MRDVNRTEENSDFELQLETIHNINVMSIHIEKNDV